MKKLIVLLLFFISTSSYSQDLIAGEITYSHLSGYDYHIFGSIYAQTSTAIPRTYFLLYAGDGSPDSIPVAPPVDSNGILTYYFSDEHVYPGPGIYYIHLEGDFLVDSVVNLPNSVHKPLYLEVQLAISPTDGFDNSPVFTQLPFDSGQRGLPFIYNPGAYDSDGDSLSYSLVAVDSGYSFAGVSIDSITGNISIDTPQSGRYLVEIKVTEWRLISGVRVNIGYVESVFFLDFTETTGITEINSEESLKLYPNPATNELTLHTSSFHSTEAITLSIMNVLGQETSPPAPLHLERGDATIYIGNLPAGIYFLQMKSESGNVVKKFIKE